MDNARTFSVPDLHYALVHGHVESIRTLDVPEKNHDVTEMELVSRYTQDDVGANTAGEEWLQDLRIIEAGYHSAAACGKPIRITAGCMESGRKPGDAWPAHQFARCAGNAELLSPCPAPGGVELRAYRQA